MSRTSDRRPAAERGAHALGPVVGDDHAQRRGRAREQDPACSASAPRTTVTRSAAAVRRFATPRSSHEPRVVGDERLRRTHPASGAGGEQETFHAASLSDGA